VSYKTVELGRFGEQLAEGLLVNLGARVLARNYRSEPGELDLVVEHEGDLVGVEVKTRTELDFEKPEEAISRRKLWRMARGLASFAQHHQLQQRHWRLDVVAIEVGADGTVTRCEHIRDAFEG
jgi:putative endonuclease